MVANPDFYHRRERIPNGKEYYELLLVYVDRVLSYLHNPKSIMDVMNLTYDLKDRSLIPPMIYLVYEINKY